MQPGHTQRIAIRGRTFLLSGSCKFTRIHSIKSISESVVTGGMAEQTSIDVKEVLVDIRSGMSDSGLMAKYAVSPKGLKNLVSEFERLGILRQVKARELLRDIRRGKTNKEIMEKYQLSKNALRKIFEEMTEAGVAVFGDRNGTPEKKRIRVSEILSDIRSGLPENQLIAKYGVSSRGLQSAF
jgi:uncharacterized protein (DUF433 family)